MTEAELRNTLQYVVDDAGNRQARLRAELEKSARAQRELEMGRLQVTALITP